MEARLGIRLKSQKFPAKTRIPFLAILNIHLSTLILNLVAHDYRLYTVQLHLITLQPQQLNDGITAKELAATTRRLRISSDQGLTCQQQIFTTLPWNCLEWSSLLSFATNLIMASSPLLTEKQLYRFYTRQVLNGLGNYIPIFMIRVDVYFLQARYCIDRANLFNNYYCWTETARLGKVSALSRTLPQRSASLAEGVE